MSLSTRMLSRSFRPMRYNKSPFGETSCNLPIQKLKRNPSKQRCPVVKLKKNCGNFTSNSSKGSLAPPVARQGRLSKLLPTIEEAGTLTDPIAIVERYETVTGLIEKRLFDYTQNYDRQKTVRLWLSNIYADQDLIAWDRERRNLEAFLPLGYFGE